MPRERVGTDDLTTYQLNRKTFASERTVWHVYLFWNFSRVTRNVVDETDWASGSWSFQKREISFNNGTRHMCFRLDRCSSVVSALPLGTRAHDRWLLSSRLDDKIRCEADENKTFALPKRFGHTHDISFPNILHTSTCFMCVCVCVCISLDERNVTD